MGRKQTTSTSTPVLEPSGNGHSGATVQSAELGIILTSLQSMRDGDFSVRLPGIVDRPRRKNRRHL